MVKISRRTFTKTCSGALTAGTFFASWPPVFAASSSAPGTTDDELTGLTLLEASTRIHNGTVTSVQLVKAMLSRIGVYDPKLNVYITIMTNEALLQAAQLDEEAKASKFRSPLHGIPIALKDNIDTAGTRTTAASPMFKTRVPAEDAEVVRRLKASGAVILGKLNLHEFALGCTGDVSYFGPSRNPWNLQLVTGGSSSGSGAAVAADLCYGALGTDTGGSIRVPSSWCGIVGIKPTTGLVSIRGIVPCLASLDHCGPMGRTVEDVALMLTQLAGYDSEDIFSVEHPPQDYFKLMKQPVSSFRLGTPVEFYDHLESEVAETVAAAVAVLTRLSFSAEYTRQFSIDTLRQAAVVRTTESKFVDSVRIEVYQRLNSHTFAGIANSPIGPIPDVTVSGASGFAATLEKKVGRLSGNVGFATVDSDYGVYAGSRFIHAVGFTLNGDTYGLGNRPFAHASFRIAPGVNAFGFYTHEVGAARVTTLNQQGYNAGMTFDFKAIINQEKKVF
jgi:Asp-tRNA(Asn)/Glu-tRNA(Gln) amidotransferase A subunit family amidase